MSKGTSSNTNKNISDGFSAIAERAFARERQLTHTPFSISKKNMQTTENKTESKQIEPKTTTKEVNVISEKISNNQIKISDSNTEKTLLDKVEEYSSSSDVNIVLKKSLTDREQMVFEYFLNNIGKTVFAKDLAELLELPRDYVYKYIKNLRAKIEGDKLKNVPSGGFILTE